MLNKTRRSKADPERNSKCPKPCVDNDEDQEEFKKDAFTRVWIGPDK